MVATGWLRGVILDASIEKREAVVGGVDGYPGPRDPGIIPVSQLNAVFGTNVPFGTAPFARMRALDDTMEDVPAFQQTGIDLLLGLLAESAEPVHLMCFGSARPLAVAFNRDPGLLREKVARVHLSAGSTSLDYLEWNVYLDPIAMCRVVESGLPLALYPCATGVDCYSYDTHNTYWRFSDLRWIEDLHPALRRYLLYGLGRSSRIDFLRALDEEPPESLKADVYGRQHAVWETAAWMLVSDSELVRHHDGTYEIVGRESVVASDAVILNRQVPCVVDSHPTGLYTFSVTDGDGDGARATVFERGDPAEYERALQEALPRLYQSFAPSAASWQGTTTGLREDGLPRTYAGPL
ncbi:hypothetical protein ACIRCZ_13270 [Leifsonia sp. NPDC102414]|uniref:hypothetical protein n=1 Tax=Leifsonia sp. NPDC102414 TaxID=3364124 RepID=UPI0037F6BD43